MSICQRANGKWLVKYKDAVTGKWKQRQFKNKEDAEVFDSAAKQAEEQKNPLSVKEAVLVYVQNNPLSEGRIERYLVLVNGHKHKRTGKVSQGYAAPIADRYVESLTRQDLEALRQRISAAGARHITVNQYTAMLKAAFNWCESEDLISVNPWRKYRNLPEGPKKHHDGTAEELRLVYQHLPPCYQWVVRTAMALCLRPGAAELFSLEWSVFDWASRTATIWMPKTKRSKTVFVPSWYYEEAHARYLQDSAAEQTLVCRNTRNRAIAQVSWKSSWSRACKKTGVKIPPYAIRHIAASEMLSAGADLASVAAQLGHSCVQTTAQFYIHALSRAQRQAAMSLPDANKFGDKI